MVALLRFDLEQGAVVDALYPAGVLHDREEKDLMALGFPESHQLQHGEGSLHYSFRLRHHSKLPLVATSANTYSFGYAMFSQKKDAQSKRGYTQRAVVIVSDMHPHIEFFQ